MNEIEILLNELPMTIQKFETQKCKCGDKYEQRVDYDLKIDVSQHCNKQGCHKRYRVYYEGDFNGSKIGISVGMGQVSLLDALKELQEILKEQQNEK